MYLNIDTENQIADNGGGGYPLDKNEFLVAENGDIWSHSEHWAATSYVDHSNYTTGDTYCYRLYFGAITEDNPDGAYENYWENSEDITKEEYNAALESANLHEPTWDYDLTEYMKISYSNFYDYLKICSEIR